MLGVEGYGSDDNSDSEPTPNTNSAALPNKLVPPLSKSTTKRIKKFTIELPRPSTGEDDDEKPAKKPRLDRDTKGAGLSGLVSMLPAPKQNNPIPSPPQRVLGAGQGPGLVFNATRPKTTIENTDHDVEELKSRPLFMPNSVSRGKPNISVEESIPRPKQLPAASAVDFFSMAESSSSRSQVTSVLPKSSLPTLSSAPKVEEFTPPEPTPQDPYPGYYLLPSGKYAAYDPTYYQTFCKKWQAEYDKYVRDLEKGKIRGFEELDEEQATGVNAMEEMEKARAGIQEREERKALTKGSNEMQAPKMNIKGAALSGRARSRHQLSTLLTEAYQNREALEEQIAQGRRNRKEAGNKYGF